MTLALQPPDTRFHFRPARVSDAEALQRTCWPERTLVSIERLLLRAQRMAQQQYGLGIVALDESGVIGYGQCALWPRCAEISDLIVCESKRCGGIGTAMIQYLTRAAREMQAGCVEIGAAVENTRALALYRRLGFKDSHVMKIHVDGAEVAVQYLRLALIERAGEGGQAQPIGGNIAPRNDLLNQKTTPRMTNSQIPTTSPARASERISGLYTVPIRAFADERGRFMETFRVEWFPQVSWERIQNNRSDSKAGVLRGLHFHHFQVDYWYVPSGIVRVGLADLRPSSPTYRATEVLEIGGENNVGVFIPTGVAHGFYALTDATLMYIVNQYYDGTDEHGVAWNDPDLGVAWGVESAILSGRDQQNPLLRDIPADKLPK